MYHHFDAAFNSISALTKELTNQTTLPHEEVQPTIRKFFKVQDELLDAQRDLLDTLHRMAELE